MLHASLALLLLSASRVAPPTADDPPPLLPRNPGEPAAPAPSAADPPPLLPRSPGEASARSASARAHYAAHRYREAAQVYEALWRDTRAAKYLFNAGMARAAAEHDGAAIVHWQAYLAAAPTIASGERSMLEGEIAAARRRTRPVHLRVEGPLAGATLVLDAPEGASQGARDPLELVPAESIELSLESGTWQATLTRPGRPASVVRFRVAADAEPTITVGAEVLAPTPAEARPPIASTAPAAPATLILEIGPRRALARGVTVTADGPAPAVTRTLRAPSSPWVLRAGAWTLRATAPDRQTASATITLGPDDTRRVALHLPRDRAAQTRLGLGLGLGGAGLVFVTAGAVVAARAPHRDLLCDDHATCSATADHVLDRSIGFSLIGTGLGAAVPAVTAGLGRTGNAPTSSDRALMAEAGVGGVLLVGGLAWYLSEVTRTTALDDIPRQHAAATLRGLGGGMLGGAVISLVVRRLTRGKTLPVAVAPSFSRHTQGLALRAQF